MDEKLLLEQIDAFVAENRENVLRDLKTLVDINSVEGQPQPGAPFGPGPRKALEAALDIAAGMGTQLRRVHRLRRPARRKPHADRHHYASGRGARGQRLDRLPV